MMYRDAHVTDQDLLLASDGELTARRQAEVRHHLEACWSCRKRIAEMERTIANFVEGYQLLTEPRLPPEDGTETAMRRRLISDPAPQSRRSVRWQWPVLAAASIVLVVVSAKLAVRWPRVINVSTNLATTVATVPNPTLTPGEATRVSQSDVCQASRQDGNREVPEALREAVFAEYGMQNAPRNAYEVDYLITPALGGSTSLRNLWSEPYNSKVWNARTKDALEERLHSLVCSGGLDLSTAQHEIATNWVGAYKKYVGANNPM